MIQECTLCQGSGWESVYAAGRGYVMELCSQCLGNGNTDEYDEPLEEMLE